MTPFADSGSGCIIIYVREVWQQLSQFYFPVIRVGGSIANLGEVRLGVTTVLLPSISERAYKDALLIGDVMGCSRCSHWGKPHHLVNLTWRGFSFYDVGPVMLDQVMDTIPALPVK